MTQISYFTPSPMLIYSQLPVITDRNTSISLVTGLYLMGVLFRSSLWDFWTKTQASREYRDEHRSNGRIKGQVKSTLIEQMVGMDNRLNKIYRVARNNQFCL